MEDIDMGMDVSGNQPTAEVGEYFRNNVWWWHPLWEYVLHVVPWVGDKVPHGHYNDGQGLDADGCAALAVALTGELESGATTRYEVDYMSGLNAMPDEECDLCNGTGTRKNCGDMGWCNGCNGCEGRGKVRPSATWYPFSAENVARFRDFVAACGGFEIW